MSDDKLERTGKAVSRRTVLKGSAAVAGIAVGSGAVSGFPTIWAQNIKDVTMRFVGSGVTHQEPWKALIEKDLGFKADFTVTDFDTIKNRGITQPRSYDLLEPTANNLRAMWPTGTFQAIDSTRLKHWEEAIDLYHAEGKIWPDARFGQGQNPSLVLYTDKADGRRFVKAGSSKWLTMVPSQHNADTLGYNRDLTGRTLETWAELISDEWQGKVALQLLPEVALMDVGMALEASGLVSYVDKGNMTRDEIDKTFAIMNDLKRQGHFRGFWLTFGESVNLMLSGEVVLQSMWSPAVTVVRAQGVNAVYADLKEGYRAWTIGFLLPKHLDGLKLDAAYAFFDWLYTGSSGAYFAKQGYYMPTPQRTKEYLSANEWGFWYEGKAATGVIKDPLGNDLEQPGRVRDGGTYKNRMGNVALWNSEPDELVYMTDKFDEFQAI